MFPPVFMMFEMTVKIFEQEFEKKTRIFIEFIWQ